MGVLEDLQKEKKAVLLRISNAAGRGETDLVLLESEKLEKIKNLTTRHSQIVSELEELKSGKNKPSSQANSIKPRKPGDISLLGASPLTSPREVGNKIRLQFIRKVEENGIDLQLIKGKTIYRTKSGKRVGVAVATERQPNRWFLGLPAGAFDHAVLLCQKENGEVIEVLLPEKFFVKYGSDMSQSKGQLKFNVVKRGNNLYVLVPGTDGVSWDFLTSDYSFLL